MQLKSNIKKLFIKGIKFLNATTNFIGVSCPSIPIKDQYDFKKSKIYISAAVSDSINGGWRYNGGIKEYNILAKILRMNNHEVKIVTFDGKYDPWLIEHQPHISLQEFKEQRGENYIAITSWAGADGFLRSIKKVYFWDMELLYTNGIHYFKLFKLYFFNKIIATAGISKTIQAWHMNEFGRECVVIPNLLDLDYWKPDPKKRISNRVGYMDEGSHTANYIDEISRLMSRQGISCEFYKISGNEAEVLNAMQSSNIFLSMNLGKSPFWGEGCPRTIIEALSVGSVLIGFELIGNREVIIDNFNAFIVEANPLSMATKLSEIMKSSNEQDRIRRNVEIFIRDTYSFERQYYRILKLFKNK